ncbi:MAG: hypothetical protein AUF67_15240 [Acidobacteria bacterium 13_1_20CM_58_21]|nr:MAG: hypothetical protein AUF67_15240 [Acidobacteria bacterium 13_1_20CM_58_21]
MRRLVVISSPYARSGWYPEVQRGMSHVSAAMAENMMQTPTGKFSKQWPEPQRFPRFLDKMGNMMSEDYDWSADIAKLPMPVLLVFADNDSVSQKHIAEFFMLLGGGMREPGWLNTQLSKSRLAVVPGYSHYNFITSAEVPQSIGKFLADPLTNAPAGAAAASQVAPPPEKKQQAWIRNRRGSVRLSSMGSSARTGRCSTLHVWAWKENSAGADRASFIWMAATLPESLFLKALTEGLPKIRPGAVDICRPMMVRYSVIYGVTR